MRKAVRFAVSQPARDLPAVQAPIKGQPGMREIEIENREILKTYKPGNYQDGALQVPPPRAGTTPPMPPPIVSFDGLSIFDDFAAFGGGVLPPDTNGAAGRAHFVQQVNILVRVWDKTGIPLTAPFKLSSLFAPLGGQCSVQDAGDPLVIYDQLADRWLLSQFAYANFTAPPYHQCIAASITGDPTGSYYLYDFVTPNNEFPDYPHLGLWPDGYYMTVNQFTNGGPFNGAGFYAFDRVKMLAGDPTASFIYFDENLVADPAGVGGALASSLDGLTLPPAGAPNVFAYFLSTAFGDAIDGLRLFDFHADFAVPANSTLTERADSPLAVAAFDPGNPSGRNDIEQPSPGVRVDSIQDRLMHRMAYRNFGASESIVVNHTVNVSGTAGGGTAATHQAGIRFYELKRTAGVFTVNQQTTYNPAPGDGAAGPNVWMGSVAMDNQGNLALGFSTSSPTIFPSVNYNGRLAGDPPGLSFLDGTLVAGTGVQRHSSGRWGDYSAMTVDPADDCTFWYTQEYYTAASQAASTAGWLTHIGSFKFPSCTASPRGSLQVTVTDCVTGAPLAGVSVQAGGYFATTGPTGVAVFPAMAPGSYTANVSKAGYGNNSVGATVTNGVTTKVAVCMSGIVILVNGGDSITAESCVPSNGSIDPGEIVTVSLCVKNTGGASTVNLIGTLEATGGVNNPSGPQNYGAVGAGATACKAFTFQASGTCGGTVTATLDLTDFGLSPISSRPTGFSTSVVYTFTLGAAGAPVVISYTGAAAPIPDADPAGVDVPLTVSGFTSTIADLDFSIDGTSCSATAGSTTVGVDHTWVGDLIFTLKSPSGTTVTLINQPTGGSGSNSGNNYCQTILDTQSGGPSIQSIVSAGAPFTGTFTPAGSLSAFNGENPNGTWMLNVSDNAGGDTGNVRFFSLHIKQFSCCSTPTFTPQALAVDVDHAARPVSRVNGAPLSNLNGVLEPGERVVVEPSWMNQGSSAYSLTGLASNLIGPTGFYAMDDTTADYGSVGAGATSNCFSATGNCYQFSVGLLGPRPSTHWDATFDENVSSGNSKTWTLHVGNSFTDVLVGSGQYRFIETILHNGVTAGCGSGIYCPADNVSRQQMAILLLLSKEGAAYTPPACTVPIFTDVPCSSSYAPWINELAVRGVTAGCGGGNYCPTSDVTRAQMSVFLLRTLEGSSYTPPACTVPIFTDVPCSSVFAPWVNELANRGITAGCGGGNFCPNSSVTNGQMAVFLTTTFGLVLYGP